MEIPDLLQELYGRIAPLSRAAVDGLDATALNAQPAPGTNHIGWLVWHLARVLDHQRVFFVAVQPHEVVGAVIGKVHPQPHP